jgi:PASTA domain
VPVLASAGIAVIAGTLILIFALTGAGSTSVVVPAASEVAGPTVSLNLLPNLVGETVDVATTQLRSLGFAMRIVTDPPSTATPGTVVAQDPAAPGPISITLPQGSTVTLHVAG